MGRHALLSASSSNRWLNCPPSARLGEFIPDSSSEYAAEGTDAHSMCEYKLRRALGLPADDPTESLSYYNKLMDDHCEDYVSFVMEIMEEARRDCPDAAVFTELRVDYSRWAEEGFGTSDAIIVSDGALHIVDFKYGEGVPVSAEDNEQMRLYSLGAAEMFGYLYGFTEVRMSVFQPRRDNVSSSSVTKESLYKWADEILKPTAELAFAGDGDYACGGWCRFCKAKAKCRKRAEENLAMAWYEFAEPALLENSEIAVILAKVDELVSWASDIKDHALAEAIKGVKFDGYKIVEGRSNRRYVNDAAVAGRVEKAGHDPYECSILGVTAMEKMLGKKQFAEILDGLIEKPAGKPVLVPVSDKRQAINISTAAADFAAE